jgi:hypothetical protein
VDESRYKSYKNKCDNFFVNNVEEDTIINIEYFSEPTVDIVIEMCNPIVIKPFDITSILEK